MVYVREFAHQKRSDWLPGERRDFTETVYWHAGLKTDSKTGEVQVQFDLSDAVMVLNYLFEEGGEPACMKSADVNDSTRVDLSDGIYLLFHLFAGGPRPPWPNQGCAMDLTDDPLTCTAFAPCQ